MPRDVECPECGETLELPKSFDPAKRVRCPECDHAFRPKLGKAKAPAKRAAAPKWLPFAIGGGVLAMLAVVAVVLLVALGGKKDKPGVAKAAPQEAVAGLPDSGKPEPTKPSAPEKAEPIVIPESAPVPFTNGPVQPLAPPVTEPTPVPAPRPRVPERKPPEGMPARLELPPLPPPGERPVLSLDPGGHVGFVKAMAFLPDGKRLATFSEDKTIRLWDLETGLAVRTIHMPNGPGNQGVLLCGAVSRDGKTMATAGHPFGEGGPVVSILSVETGEVVRTFAPKARPSWIDFSADGRALALSHYDGTVEVTDVATGKPTAELKGHKGSVIRARFHPKDRRIVTAGYDQAARIWTPGPQGYTSIELKGHTGIVNDAVWSPDGKTVATGSGDGQVLTHTDAGKPLKTYPKQESRVGSQGGTVQVASLAFTRDGKDLVFGGVCVRGHAGLLNLASGERRVDREDHNNTVMGCAASPKGDLAVSAGGDNNEVIVWRTTDGSVVQRLYGESRTFWAVSAGAGGTVLAGTVNKGSPVPLSRPLEFGFSLDRLDFAPVPERRVGPQQQLGGWALGITSFTTVTVEKDGQPFHVFHTATPNDRFYSATLLGSGRMVVGAANSLQLIDLASKQVTRTFRGHVGMVTCISPVPDVGMIATAGSDQTVRLWRLDRDEPVVSLFFAGREWIAWTPEGYYAASPGGERLMGWQVNRGPLKTGTTYSAIQFRQSLYQPEVIRNLGAAKGDLGLALALATRELRRPIPAVTLAMVLPPEVAITSPKTADGGEVASAGDTIEVEAKAKPAGQHAVKAMRLLVDGRPYGGAGGLKTFPAGGGEVTAKWTVALSPGRHTLVVQADAGVSKGLSAGVDVAQAGEVKPPSLYVFAVGVNEYAGKMRLNFAKSDAESMAAVLKSKTVGVFENVEVNLLTDRKATKAGIAQGLDWLGSKMTARDVGIFYFSGHGARDEDDGNKFYLVPVDVNPRGLAASCVPGDAVKDKLAAMPGRLLAVFDACHSGAAAESLKAGGAGDLARELVTDDCGVAVLCSSMGDEYSIESGQTKAGFFTYSLVEGLSGKADLNGDGYVHIHEATTYAAMRVRQLSQGQQNPTLGRSPYLKPFALTKK